MARYDWLVMCDCDPAQHAEFNRWYDETHLADLTRVPGIVSARRYDLAAFQATSDPLTGNLDVSLGALPGQLPYLAIYEFETDDPQEVLEEVIRRAGTPDMEISEHLREVKMHLYQRR